MAIRRLSRKARAGSKLRSAIAKAAVDGRADRLIASACRTRSSTCSISRPSSPAPSTATARAAARASRPSSAGSSVGALRLSGQLCLPRCHRARRSAGGQVDASSGGPSTAARSRSTARRAVQLRRLARLYRHARATRTSTCFPLESVRLDSYWLGGARVAYAVRPGVELFARRRQRLRRRAIRTCSAIAPKGGASMPASALLLGASAAVRVASLNLCTDEYLLLLARPAEIASVSYLSHDPRGIAAVASGAALSRQSRSDRGRGGARPDLVLTMGGGGRATGCLRGGSSIRSDRPAASGDARRRRANLRASSPALGDRAPRCAVAGADAGAARNAARARPRDAIWLSAAAARASPPDSLGAQWMRLAGFSQRAAHRRPG